jgi:hypothetical protein
MGCRAEGGRGAGGGQIHYLVSCAPTGISPLPPSCKKHTAMAMEYHTGMEYRTSTLTVRIAAAYIYIHTHAVFCLRGSLNSAFHVRAPQRAYIQRTVPPVTYCAWDGGRYAPPDRDPGQTAVCTKPARRRPKVPHQQPYHDTAQRFTDCQPSLDSAHRQIYAGRWPVLKFLRVLQLLYPSIR